MIWYVGRLIPGTPRGVGHTAYSIFINFNLFVSQNPQSNFDDAAKFVLKSRKSTYKKTNDEEIEFFINISTSLGDLITIVIIVEDPAAFNYTNAHSTRSSLRNFYQKYCPSELKKLSKTDFIIRMVHEKRTKYKAILNILSPLTDRFVVAFEEADYFSIGRTLEYITKTYFYDNEIRDIAKELIEYVMDGDDVSAARVMMSLIEHDSSAKPHIEAGFSAIVSGDNQLAFDEFLKAFTFVKRNT